MQFYSFTAFQMQFNHFVRILVFISLDVHHIMFLTRGYDAFIIFIKNLFYLIFFFNVKKIMVNLFFALYSVIIILHYKQNCQFFTIV